MSTTDFGAFPAVTGGAYAAPATSEQATAPERPAWSNVKAPDARSQPTAAVAFTNGRRALKVFLANPNALFGTAFLALVIAVALLAPVLYPDDPLSMVGKPFLWPGQDPAFPLGTDSLGRDVLAGILHGSRISLFVGLMATALSLTFGVFVGAIAGYFAGWVDDLLVRLIEIFQTLPSFVLLVVLVAIVQPSATTVTLAIAVISWPTVARLTRAEFRLPPIIVTSSVMVATAILMESALSFMGLGDPNVVSWGSMIGTGRELVRTAWYLTALPGLAIVFTVLALNLIGDGLNDALNPRFTQDR
ncbi:ABC transporter permease [Sinorhizobium medicae]|uniref:ABC transporter permease n=1 Tax=Sinorhizobium medicae TaxID=110321 RepID=UPI000C7E126E|nr:ABC transporter permease [Sinorhizobium medicae]PLU00200.1 ABC transporter permease [Sinorhizobium medicae]